MLFSNDHAILFKELTIETGFSQPGLPIFCYGSKEDLLALLRMTIII